MMLKLSLGALMASFTVAVAFDMVFDQCDVDESTVFAPADLIDVNGVNVFGCAGSFIRFDMAKNVEDVPEFECEFELGDDLPGLKLDTMDSDSLAAKSETPNPIVTCEGSPPFEMTVTMVVAKYPEYPPIEDGQGTVRVPSGDITANTRILQRFNGVNQNDVLLDVDVNFDMPSLGYVLVRNGNGRMMALAGQTGPPGVETWRRMKIAVPSGYNNTPVDVLIVGQNSIEDFSDVKPVKMDFSIDKAVTTNAPTTTTPATTTAEDPLNNLVEVFTVAVDENYFVETHYETLKNDIKRFAPNCTVDFDRSTGGLPVSCREECWMTDSKARGCVLVTADVVKDIYCPYSNRQLRHDLTNKVLKQWAKDFEAAHISVDDCMADSSGWIVVTVLIPIAVAVLFVGGFFGAKAWKKRRQVELRRQQSDAMEKKRSRSRSGGSRAMNEYGDGGGASRFAYTNRLEILDEED